MLVKKNIFNDFFVGKLSDFLVCFFSFNLRMKIKKKFSYTWLWHHFSIFDQSSESLFMRESIRRSFKRTRARSYRRPRLCRKHSRFRFRCFSAVFFHNSNFIGHCRCSVKFNESISNDREK